MLKRKFSEYRIMIVDDSQDFLDALIEINKAKEDELGYGFTFHTYTDHFEALRELQFSRNKYDMLILDYQLNNYTAEEFLEVLREFNETLYVMLLTSQTSTGITPARIIVDNDIQSFCNKLYSELKDSQGNFMQFYDHLLQLICSALKCVDVQNRLMEQYKDVICILRNIVEAKSKYTLQHSSRVAEYSVSIYKKLHNYTEDAENYSDLELLEYACFFHDIGKIKIPDSILNKAERLSDEEYFKIKTHVLEGVKILEGVTFRNIRKVIAQHHERLDGRGYPFALVEEDIDDMAKIIAVADSFDAMTSGRQYMSARTPEDAFDELTMLSKIEYKNNDPVRNSAGRIIEGYQYDRKVVDAFKNCWYGPEGLNNILNVHIRIKGV